MSDILSLKNNNKLRQNKLEANLQKFLNWGNDDLKNLQKSFGLLKLGLKKTPVSIQRNLRKELDR